jgi:hypothetical protein
MPFPRRDHWLRAHALPFSRLLFLNKVRLEIPAASPHFLNGDVSYLSPLDSAATLSVMKTFRVYKPVLGQAWFLEVLHASPRWIGSATQIATLATQKLPGWSGIDRPSRLIAAPR